MTNLLRFLSGPVAALLLWFFADLEPGKPAVTLMAGVTLWVALWWLFEVLDLAVTSFLPLILLPALGLMDMKEVAAQYMEPIVFLFVGGFIISFAVEKWGLHKRLSLWVLQAVGNKLSSILGGVMLIAFFISMWISNTATVLMLYPAVMAVQQHVRELHPSAGAKTGIALLLGLAYAASIGGMATLVGTPTNMIFYNTFTRDFPDDHHLTFGSWFLMAFPVGLCMVVFAYFVLRYFYLSKFSALDFDRQYFRQAYRALGRFSYEEKWVSAVFGLTVLLWFTRADFSLGFATLPGWSALFPQPKWIQDGTVAMFMAMLLFLIPARRAAVEASPEEFVEGSEGGIWSNTLLVWEDTRRFPFGIILLFGAGFALSQGFEVSGLSVWLAHKLTFLQGASPLMVIVGICAVVCVISEFASNVASIQLTLPILTILCQELHVHPLVLMVPATLAASLGFMLPVATAPNTIVFSSRLIPVSAMVRSGFWLNLFGISLISLLSYSLLAWILGL